MKSKFGFIRVLAVAFALVLSISLVSCVKDEDLNTVKTDAGKTQENVDQLQTSVKALQDKLDALTGEVKTLTDTAATQAALKEAVEQLKALETSISGYPSEFENIQNALTGIEANLATAQAAIADAASKQALEDAKTAINNAKADKSEVEAVKTALETAKTAFEKKIADLQKELYGENGNGGKFAEVSAKITEVNNKLADYAKTQDLTALATRVANLETWKNSFADKKYLDDYIDFTTKLKDENGTYQYSVKNFFDAANEVAEGPYDDNEIKEFNKKIDSIALFLARAVTEADAKWCFDQLATAKAQLKTLEETLAAKLDAFTVIANNTATKNAYKDIVKAYDKLYAKDPAAATALTRYTLITNAYNNFFGTDTLPGAVGAGANIVAFVNTNLTGKTVVVGDSDANVNDAVAQYTAYKTAFFSNNEWNAFYGVVENGQAVNKDAETVAASLANGKEINGYAKRLELLKAAKTYADANITMTFNWNDYNGGTDERPLYNNTANKALLDAIAATTAPTRVAKPTLSL